MTRKEKLRKIREGVVWEERRNEGRVSKESVGLKVEKVEKKMENE